jgi:hypothetical protein
MIQHCFFICCQTAVGKKNFFSPHHKIMLLSFSIVSIFGFERFLQCRKQYNTIVVNASVCYWQRLQTRSKKNKFSPFSHSIIESVFILRIYENYIIIKNIISNATLWQLPAYTFKVVTRITSMMKKFLSLLKLKTKLQEFGQKFIHNILTWHFLILTTHYGVCVDIVICAMINNV